MSRLEEFGYKQELVRALSTRDLIVHGMIFMGPIAPFAVFGFVWTDARGMVVLAYLLGLLGMSFTALSYAAMARAFPMAGSVYSYVQRGVHEVAGFFAGWLILLDYILVPALCYVFSVVALRPLLPGVPDWIWIVSFVSLNAVINVRGVQLGARVNRFMLMLSAGYPGAVHGGGSGGALPRPGRGRADAASGVRSRQCSRRPPSRPRPLSRYCRSSASTPCRRWRRRVAAAATRSPVPRCRPLLFVALLFIAQTWLAADLARGMRFQSTDTAFYEIAERAGGVALRDLALAALAIASLANALVGQSAIARILFAMARDRRLPSILARVHPRYRTPHVSTLVVAAVSLAVCLLFARRGDDLSRVVNFGALSSFLLLHVSVINHYFIRGRSRDWLRHLVLPLGGLLVIGYVLYAMDRSAKVLGACWIGAGVVYYAGLVLVRKRTPVLGISPGVD